MEIAPNVVRWIKLPAGAGRMVPRSMHHDFFGIWDAVAFWSLPGGPYDHRAGCYQVTVDRNVSDRRRKILAAGFPHNEADAILGYVAGRRRHFRVYRGGALEFGKWDGEAWLVPPDPKKPPLRARGASGSKVAAGAA